MSEFAARIGRVRLKGGADVTIIEGWRQPDDGLAEATLHECVREASEPCDMTAFFLVTMHDSGAITFSHRINPECHMARTLMPAYVSELVRRNALQKHDSREVFENMFEWAE